MRAGGFAYGRGFTLIELLVVIAIIAILASILFPVFARARSKARQASCLSNMKQLATAILMYVDDASEFLPRWSLVGGSPTGGNPGGHPYTWDEQIYPYTRNNQILVCPENPFGGAYRSYALPRYVSGIQLARFPSPVRTVVLFEKGKYDFGVWEDATGENFNQSHTSEGQPGYSDLPFHSTGKNFAFLDGHVKWYTKTAGPFADAFRPGAAPGSCEYAYPAPAGDWPPAQ
jgi:prepilin-type N-terminal cleavage/methylation domain-containing protein/prepilin-type processing-associated H-X9-DG protein